MLYSLIGLFLFATTLIPSAVAQDSCEVNTATIAPGAVVFFASTDTAEFSPLFIFSGCELETVVPVLQFPSGYTVACTVPVNVDEDFLGPEGDQYVTCAISAGSLPAGAYAMSFVLGNGGSKVLPFTVTHTEVTLSSFTTITVPVTSTQTSETTVFQPTTATTVVHGQTITKDVGGSTTTISGKVSTVTKTSTITKGSLQTQTSFVTATTCVPKHTARRRGMRKRQTEVTTTDLFTSTITQPVLTTTDATLTDFTTVTSTETGAPVTTTVSLPNKTLTARGSTVTSVVSTTTTIHGSTTITKTTTATRTGHCT